MYLYLSKLNYLFESFLRKIFPKTIYIKIFYAKNKLLGLDNSFKHFTNEQIFENIYKQTGCELNFHHTDRYLLKSYYYNNISFKKINIVV